MGNIPFFIEWPVTSTALLNACVNKSGISSNILGHIVGLIEPDLFKLKLLKILLILETKALLEPVAIPSSDLQLFLLKSDNSL